MELEGVLNILGGWETKMKMIDQLKNTSHRQKKKDPWGETSHNAL
jgi:hypothetical protein